MPKPKRIVRPRILNLSIPEDLFARLQLHLYSELEGRVPFGAYSKFINQLIQKELQNGTNPKV